MSRDPTPSDAAKKSMELASSLSGKPVDTGFFTTSDDAFDEEEDTNPELCMGIRGGILVDLLDPSPSVFRPESIARSLAFINRFAGNYGAYSVAQHAFLVATMAKALKASPFQQFAALHHDDVEAITNDIPSPIKRAVPEFYILENRLNAALEARYAISITDGVIKVSDEQVFANEVMRLVPAEHRWMYAPYPDVEIILPYSMLYPWGPEKAYAKYMDLHDKLTRLTNKVIVETCQRSGIEA
jgi:hypothetical protein